MDWLKTLAPLLGTALAGPLGAAAASFIADKLDIEEKTIEAVTEVLNAGKLTPEQIGNIKLAELDFQKFIKDHDIKLDEISAGDRANARDMRKSTSSPVPAMLTLLITFGFFGVLGWMLYDAGSVDSPPLLIMLGSLGTAWTGACAFWFGTTSGSAAKNQLLANSTPLR